jgi:hypothetical protein
MPKMDSTTLKAILQGERQDALSSATGSDLSEQRRKALDYYQGEMTDMPSIDGRSRAVSTDVADTVEGLMPQLLEIFEGSDDVVKFEPVGAEDVEAAQQETDTVNYVYRQQNDGFLTTYQMVKDALLSKTGIGKVWWEEKETKSRETYYDQPEEVFQYLSQHPDFEVVAHTDHDGLHDITIETTKDESQCCVEAVPPEEMGISRHTKVNIQTAPYLYHEPAMGMSERELIEAGYDEEQIKELPTYATPADEKSSEQQARDTVLDSGENQADTVNKPNRRLRITEHYTWLDYEGDGVARRYRIVTGGEDSTVLKRDGELDIEEIEWWPFAAGSPIINPHRFYGRSIADIVMDIQRIKTALTRGLLDNINFAINPRPEVSEEGSTPETLSDVMVWRPGAPIRVKTPGTVVWQTPMDITGTVYPALQYFDATREWRTGVTKQGQGIDANALQNQTATAVNNVMQATQARMVLIARILAETLFTDLMWLIHSTVRKYGSQEMTVKLRNQWVPVNPREWKERKDMTINVGLGRGSKAEEAMVMQTLMQMQAAAAETGILQITPKNFYHAMQDYCRVNKIKDADRYFPDPGDAPMPEPPPDPQMVKAQMDAQTKQQEMQFKQQELQAKAAIEQVQAQADVETNDRKTAADIALAEKKFELDRELKLLEFQLKAQEHQADLQVKARGAEMDEKIATRKLRFEMNAKRVKQEEDLNDEGEVKLNDELKSAISRLEDMQTQVLKAAKAKRKTTIRRDPKTKRVVDATSEIDE